MPEYKTVQKLTNKGYERMIAPSGYQWYYLNGKLHRPDGPAYNNPGGYKTWYLEGTKLEPEQVQTLKYLQACPLSELPLYINTIYRSIVEERLR